MWGAGNYVVASFGLDEASERPLVGTSVRCPLWYLKSSGAPLPPHDVPPLPPTWAYPPPLPSRGMLSLWPHDNYTLHHIDRRWNGTHQCSISTSCQSTSTTAALCRMTSNMVGRDQPNSRDKMRDFMVEFLKCVKLHGQFTEGVTNDAKQSIAK